MQLEQSARGTAETWSGTVPSAIDGRVLGLIVVTAALAASINLPYAGLPAAVAAFALLSVVGSSLHVLGERKLRRITDGLVERWVAAGGEIDDVTRSSSGTRTEWRIHTPDGAVVVGGVALVPIARLSVEWRGIGDTMAASEAEANLDRLAAGLYREIFEFDANR